MSGLDQLEAKVSAIAAEDALLQAHGWIWREGSNFWNHPEVSHTCTREHALNRIRMQSSSSDSALAPTEAITEERSATAN